MMFNIGFYWGDSKPLKALKSHQSSSLTGEASERATETWITSLEQQNELLPEGKKKDKGYDLWFKSY